MLRIGELARAAGVSVDTLRFYERRGLLAPAARSEGGYRLYDEAALARLAFIQRAKALGFTLAEIGGVLGVMEGGQPPCAHVRALLEEKLADLERQMELLA
ncbi:heavy metal-responsive transcriptional regulator, partial [Oceanithermus desulfurans]